MTVNLRVPPYPDGARGSGLLVGNTPLVGLDRYCAGTDLRVHAKLEMLNPGGSGKDRTALAMVAGAISDGAVVPGLSTIIESSSGNLGIGLAQVCCRLDLEFVCVIDDLTTKLNVAILESLGARIEWVHDGDVVDGQRLKARLDRVQQLLSSTPDSYWPNQYANVRNAEAQWHMMREICEQLGKPPDVVFCATSTGGTLRGCGNYLAQHAPATRLIPVDATGSSIFRPGVGRRLLPGHGASLRPLLIAEYDGEPPVFVTDAECVSACLRLAALEGMLVGASSGAVLSALYRRARQLPAGATCVVIFADRGERYLDTIYSQAWVEREIGNLPAVWY